jgi:hypothetical protein
MHQKCCGLCTPLDPYSVGICCSLVRIKFMQCSYLCMFAWWCRPGPLWCAQQLLAHDWLLVVRATCSFGTLTSLLKFACSLQRLLDMPADVTSVSRAVRYGHWTPVTQGYLWSMGLACWRRSVCLPCPAAPTGVSIAAFTPY